MKPYLIVLCAGDESLHEKNMWHEGKRSFDLAIVYYGSDAVTKQKYESYSDYFFEVSGPKWQNIVTVLQNNAFWKNYEYMWLPDDDLEVSLHDVQVMFNIVAKEQCELSQPSLHPQNVSYKFLVHDPNVIMKSVPVRFVELQMPCFKVSTFDNIVFPFLVDNMWSISGWGFDYYWSTRIQRKYLLNSIIVRHTKPVSISSGFYKKFNANPVDEMKKLMSKYSLKTSN